MTISPLRAATAAAMLLLAGAPPPARAVAACAGGGESPDIAIAHCTAALDSTDRPDTERAAALTRRGLAWFVKRDLAKAVADFDEAIRLDGNSYWAFNSRAIVWMQRRQFDRAIADYDRAIQLKPDYAESLANRGNAWLVKGDVDRGLTDLDRAIALAPVRPEVALTIRGRVWLAKGDADRAERDFDAALEANPKYANAVSGRAYARFNRGEFDAAAVEFKREYTLRRDNESAVAWVVAVRRAGRDAKPELAEVMHDYDASQGLPAGLALFSERLTPAQVLQSAQDPDPEARRARACGTYFQVGEWYVLNRDVAAARRQLALARDTCDRNEPEYSAATAELTRLGSR